MTNPDFCIFLSFESMTHIKKNVFSDCIQIRPFDIGDRIIIAAASGEANGGVARSWFVEGELERWLGEKDIAV